MGGEWMNETKQIELAEETVKWYWKYAPLRDPLFALPASWLERLHAALCVLVAARDFSNPDHGTVAVWGPSQSGKSTLISQFVDTLDDPDGQRSALSWPSAPPAVFLGSASTTPDTVVLNPHNQKSDASGCVTRYILKSDAEIRWPLSPVTVQIAKPTELMHALAAGYESECASDVHLSTANLEERLAELSAPSQPESRPAVEAVLEFVDVLDMLIQSSSHRYNGLDRKGSWHASTRRKVLECPALRADPRTLLAFAADVLWDSKVEMTKLYQRLCDCSAKWFPESAQPVHCSLAVAAALLDIESYTYLTEVPGDGQETVPAQHASRLRSSVVGLGRVEKDGVIVLEHGAGVPMIQNDEDFGLFQGLVRELLVPLRAEALPAGSAFAKFLSKVDLLDFPGVALEQQGPKETELDPDTLSDGRCLLTQVLKRGKTSSIVCSYAKSRGLDAFLLLNRAGDYPAKAIQLANGLKVWWHFIEPAYDSRKQTRPPLPLFLGMTFFSTIIDSVAEMGLRTGLRKLFDMLRKLGPLSHPNVASTFALTYKHIGAGKITCGPDEAAKAAGEIQADTDFLRQFASPKSLQSFTHMVDDKDGGVSFLLEAITAEVSPARRIALLTERRDDALAELEKLLREVCPQGQEAEMRRKQLEALCASILGEVSNQKSEHGLQDTVTRTSYALRQLVDVDPDTLDPLPQSAVSRKVQLEPYVKKQFENWIDSKRTQNGDLEWIGLADPVLRSQILAEMVEGADVAGVARWLMENFGHVATVRDALVNRRHLSWRMSGALLPFLHAGDAGAAGAADSVHRPLQGDDGALVEVAMYVEAGTDTADDAYKRSPHFRAFVAPFVDYLLRLAERDPVDRPPQKGDDEAQALFDKLL